MKKNDYIKISIDDITLDGSGVGRYEDMAVFVPATVTGDVINAKVLKVKSHYAYAKVEDYIENSKHRIPVDCDTFLQCGGCLFRHINYNKELEIKKSSVQNNIKKFAGINIDVNEILYSSKIDGYRNKGQFPICRNKDGKITVGFFSRRSHRAISFNQCVLHSDELNQILEIFKEYANSIDNENLVYDEITNKGLFRHIYIRQSSTNKYLIVLVINGDSIPKKDLLINKMTNIFGEKIEGILLNINCEKTNVILGKKFKKIYGNDYLEDTLCGVKVKLSPLSFYQINHDVAEMVYKKAAEYAEPKGKIILDLYCGTGTIGLSMAKDAKKIVGVEVVEDAIKDANINAKNNGFKNCDFICDDATGAAKTLRNSGIKPDVVILDPPRKGCSQEVLSIIANDFCPERVVYVSCDSATLARDLKILNEMGYKVIDVTAADMFPRTGHCESITLLTRRV